MRKIMRLSTALLMTAILFSNCKKENVTNSSSTPPVANAGTSQTIEIPTTSVTLTGTGTTTNGAIVGYLWSLVSGPNVPVIVSESSATTTITGLALGNYIFQFAVIDEAGLTGVDTISIAVAPNSNPIQTLVLQPANNVTEFHFLGNATVNQSGHSTNLMAGAWTVAGDQIGVHGAMQFNLGALPAGANIISAKLSLYTDMTPGGGNQVDANSGTNNSMYIRQISSSWSDATATWLNQPTTTSNGQISVPHTNLSFLDLTDIDVTALTIAMHSGNNYGFMILLQNEVPYNVRQFCSSYDSDASKHPKLVITYQ